MSEHKVNAVTLSAWLFASMTAPLAQIGAGKPWLVVLAVGAACGLLCWCVHALSGGACVRAKWYCILQLVWLAVAAGTVASWTGACWPTGTAFPAVPLVLLALAAASAWDGADRASRTGGVVFWFVAMLYAIILVAGTKNLNTTWMRPEWEKGGSMLIFVFLIPTAATFLPRGKGKGYFGVLLCVLGFAAIAALWTVGALSSNVAKDTAFPFYEYSKSLSLLGVAERFEAFVSVVLTMGYYALLSLFMTGAGHLAEEIFPGGGRIGILTAGAVAVAVLLLLPDRVMIWLPAAAIFLWAVLPLTVHGTRRLKKPKKDKKPLDN